MAEDDDITLVLDYQTTLNRVADTAAGVTRDLWLNLPSFNRDQIEPFTRDVRPVIAGARAEGAELATGFIYEFTGFMPRPYDLRLPDPPWDAPFLQTWHDLKVGYGPDVARRGGASRAHDIGFDAAQNGATARMTNTGLREVGWRRVPQPGACDWCLLVSAQRYTSREAASFGHGKGKHKSCHCTVVGIYGKRDPGRTIAQSRVREAKASGTLARVNAARNRSRAQARL